jgi:phage-related protein
MPLVRKLEPNLWEIRVRTGSGNARLLISLAEDTAILLHAFMKKSQKTPLQDLQLARTRRSWLTGG